MSGNWRVRKKRGREERNRTQLEVEESKKVDFEKKTCLNNSFFFHMEIVACIHIENSSVKRPRMEERENSLFFSLTLYNNHRRLQFEFVIVHERDSFAISLEIA